MAKLNSYQERKLKLKREFFLRQDIELCFILALVTKSQKQQQSCIDFSLKVNGTIYV